MRKVVGLESDNEESESEEEAADLDSDEEEMKQMETEALEHMKSQLKVNLRVMHSVSDYCI